MNNLEKWNDINNWRITLAQKEAAKGLAVTDNTSLPDLIEQVDNLDKRNLQSKEVTPTKQDQLITADLTYTGLSDVDVKAIPDQYKDTTITDATPNNILAGKKAAVNISDNNGIITGTIQTYIGDTTITPTEHEQVLDTHVKYNESNIIINAIPSDYKNTDNVNIESSDILAGKIGVNSTGEVVGTIATYDESNTISPSISTQIINTQNKYLDTDLTVTPVTSSIDPNIQPENIKKGISILGTVGDFDTADSGGKYLVQVIDYDGTVLKQDHLDTGATFTLPDNPTNTGLIFQEWSSPVTITNGVITVGDSDIIIGAIYTTASGLSEFDIELTTVTGLSVTLNMNGTKNWGDGTSDTLTTHTYSNVGEYTITCDGTTFTHNGNTGVFGQQNTIKNYYCRKIRLTNITNISASDAFSYCYGLTSITISNSITIIRSYMFYNCNLLSAVVIPNSVTIIQNYTFGSCDSLKVVVIPNSVINIQGYAFSYSGSLFSAIIPESATSIGSSIFYNCYSLRHTKIPESATSIGDSIFYCCNSLIYTKINENITSIGSSMFYGCYSLISVIQIPIGITNIGSKAFYNCYAITEYDLTEHDTPPTLGSTVFLGINGVCKIKVKSTALTAFQTATNWSTYANYMVVGD